MHAPTHQRVYEILKIFTNYTLGPLGTVPVKRVIGYFSFYLCIQAKYIYMLNRQIADHKHLDFIHLRYYE